MTAKKPNKVSIICAALVAAYILISLAVFVYYNVSYKQATIFADISELDALNEYISGDIEDKKVGDIPFVNSFVHEIKYKSQKCRIYAYEFETHEAAAEYYAAVMGHPPLNDETDWRSNGGLGITFRVLNEFIAIDGKNLYYIRCFGSTRRYFRIREYIDSVFTVKLSE